MYICEIRTALRQQRAWHGLVLRNFGALGSHSGNRNLSYGSAL